MFFAQFCHKMRKKCLLFYFNADAKEKKKTSREQNAISCISSRLSKQLTLSITGFKLLFFGTFVFIN